MAIWEMKGRAAPAGRAQPPCTACTAPGRQSSASQNTKCPQRLHAMQGMMSQCRGLPPARQAAPYTDGEAPHVLDAADEREVAREAPEQLRADQVAGVLREVVPACRASTRLRPQHAHTHGRPCLWVPHAASSPRTRARMRPAACVCDTAACTAALGIMGRHAWLQQSVGPRSWGVRGERTGTRAAARSPAPCAASAPGRARPRPGSSTAAAAGPPPPRPACTRAQLRGSTQARGMMCGGVIVRVQAVCSLRPS